MTPKKPTSEKRAAIAHDTESDEDQESGAAGGAAGPMIIQKKPRPGVVAPRRERKVTNNVDEWGNNVMSLESMGINAYIRFIKIEETKRIGFSDVDVYQGLSGKDNHQSCKFFY